MFHPCVIAAYHFNRMHLNPIDSCTDVAEYNGVPVAQLAQFLITMGIATGIDAQRLELLA